MFVQCFMRFSRETLNKHGKAWVRGYLIESVVTLFTSTTNTADNQISILFVLVVVKVLYFHCC